MRQDGAAQGSIETITVLFTDLVGSTALSAQVGTTAAEALRKEHFMLLRKAIDQTGGREVKNLGDGLMVVFASAARAVDCSISMQQRVEQRNRRAEQRFSIRIGIALGDSDCREGDYFGLPVIEASRLCAKASGDQILCGEVVQMMAAGRNPNGFEPIGACQLKGLPQPVRAFEVRWHPLVAAAAVPLPVRLRGTPPVSYVGRTTERELLSLLLLEAFGGTPRLALISGEPGIGKTRLATLVAIEAHVNGAMVLYGRCDEDLGVPYQAWMEALGEFVEAAPAELLRAHVERYGGELVRLVPGLRHRLPDVPAPRESDPETERYLLYGAVAGLLLACSEEEPIVLILDDLHWADKQTLALLRYLASSRAPLGALLIGTYRESDIAEGHPLADTLAGLRRESGVTRISLRGLGDDDVQAMFEAAAGQQLSHAGLKLVHAVNRETDGNPFFVAELMRHLFETGGIVQDDEGRWSVRDLAELGLPESVREVIGRRIARLGPEIRRVLSIGSVIGREFDFDLLRGVSDFEADELLELLDEAIRAAVLSEDATPGRYTFVHALVNHTLYEDLTVTRRALLHARIAEELEQICASKPGSRLPELARHWAAATTPVSSEKAIDYAHQAGMAALEQLAPDEGLRWFKQALELLDAAADPNPESRCELLIGLGDARRQVGDPRFRETLLEACRIALDCRDDERLVRAVLANNRGRTSGTGRTDRERLAFVEAALERTRGDETADRARLQSLLALELVFDADSGYERRRALSDEALECARRIGDDRALANVLRDRAYVLWAPGVVAEREAGALELLEVAERLGDPVVRFWALYNDVDIRMQQADVIVAQRQSRECLAIAEQLRQPTLQWAALVHETCIALATEELEVVEALSMRALEVGQASGEPDALISFAAQWGVVLIEQARWAECIPPGEKAARGFPGLPAFHASLGIQYLDAGRPDEARRVIDEALARGLTKIGGTPITSTALALYAETAARLGDRDTAAQLDELMRAVSEQVIWNAGVNTFNVTSYYKGLLAAALGRENEAEGRFQEAIALNQRIGADRWCIRPYLAWAEMLQRGGARENAMRATRLFAEALEQAERSGCPALGARAERGLENSTLPEDTTADAGR